MQCGNTRTGPPGLGSRWYFSLALGVYSSCSFSFPRAPRSTVRGEWSNHASYGIDYPRGAEATQKAPFYFSVKHVVRTGHGRSKTDAQGVEPVVVLPVLAMPRE